MEINIWLTYSFNFNIQLFLRARLNQTLNKTKHYFKIILLEIKTAT